MSSLKKLKMFILSVCFIGFGVIYCIYSILNGSHGSELSAQSAIPSSDFLNPWSKIPEFILYVRFTSGDRWDQEYKDILIRTMRLFFPTERAKLVVVLDDEKEDDHELGKTISNEWPFPKVCYSKEGDQSIYHNLGKSRMYLDMFHPEKCSTAPYIGFIDTDTFFSTYVTPSILFENGRPVIVAKIGSSTYPCWDLATEIFLGKKEVLQCMSTFPVMVKTEHLVEMRERLSAQHDKPFDLLFRDAPIEAGGPFCICQFSIMCNYFWYYHRDEYSWHIEMVPNDNMNTLKLTHSMASKQYYQKEIDSHLTVPIPRSTIHIRYLILNGVKFEQQEPPLEVMEGFIRESLCYSAGFDFCPKSCRMYHRNKIHKNLFNFEFTSWLWDKRCRKEQERHYKEVKDLVSYYVSKGMEVFGLKSIDELCVLIESSDPYDL